jgi:CRP-like cAMP-binding protein
MLDASFFKKIFMFQDLEEDEINKILALASLRDFHPGSVIIQEGKSGDSMFIMCQGEVQITKILTLVLSEDTPRERVMTKLKADDGVSFGEMALLENDVRSATVTAQTSCRLLELHREDFLRVINQDPVMGLKIVYRLAQLLSRYLRKTNQDVVKLTTALAVALGG